MRRFPYAVFYSNKGDVVLVAAAGLLLWHIKGPRVVVRAVVPDGSEFCVVQTRNWDLEFFTTSCYYRKRGGQYGWFHYDHEDGVLGPRTKRR